MSEDHEARYVWYAMLAGHASVIEEFVSEGRVYVVLRLRAAGSDGALTEREADVVVRHANGASSKCVGFALGITPPTVSAHLRRALGKLGLATLGDLVRVYERLTRPAKDLRVTMLTREGACIVSQLAPADPVELTTAEREVARLVAAGLSNAAIAAVRRRSERTVANQVARLLQKLGVPSRHQVGRWMGTGTIPLGRNLRPGSAASTLDSIGESFGAQA